MGAQKKNNYFTWYFKKLGPCKVQHIGYLTDFQRTGYLTDILEPEMVDALWLSIFRSVQLS